MKEKFLSWQGTKGMELFLSCCGFDSYISLVGKKLLSAFGTVCFAVCWQYPDSILFVPWQYPYNFLSISCHPDSILFIPWQYPYNFLSVSCHPDSILFADFFSDLKCHSFRTLSIFANPDKCLAAFLQIPDSIRQLARAWEFFPDSWQSPLSRFLKVLSQIPDILQQHK